MWSYRERQMTLENCYEDTTRADAYAQLAFANTYLLAYRDLPIIIRQHVTGTCAIDFGCGTGRSTRFVRDLGFETIGVDISAKMIAKAKELDRAGDYRVIAEGGLAKLPQAAYDLVLSVFPFDNIPGFEPKVRLFRDLRALMKPSGRVINVVSSPEIYTHEWASFSTHDFPENCTAQPGDIVRIVTTDFGDRRPAEDILWSDELYRKVYACADLRLIATYRPLATGDEPYRWVNETAIAPWVISVLSR
jgi:SAM-dependent methyltransferase